jgi:hypothetical protein
MRICLCKLAGLPYNVDVIFHTPQWHPHQVSNPRQEDVESLVKLVRTIGGTLEESGVRTLGFSL